MKLKTSKLGLGQTKRSKFEWVQENENIITWSELNVYDSKLGIPRIPKLKSHFGNTLKVEIQLVFSILDQDLVIVQIRPLLNVGKFLKFIYVIWWVHITKMEIILKSYDHLKMPQIFTIIHTNVLNTQNTIWRAHPIQIWILIWCWKI
jgi:hypothetical protein